MKSGFHVPLLVVFMMGATKIEAFQAQGGAGVLKSSNAYSEATFVPKIEVDCGPAKYSLTPGGRLEAAQAIAAAVNDSSKVHVVEESPGYWKVMPYNLFDLNLMKLGINRKNAKQLQNELVRRVPPIRDLLQRHWAPSADNLTWTNDAEVLANFVRAALNLELNNCNNRSER